MVERGQHAQTEEVELDQPGGGAVVLVPLEHAAAGHPAPLHRADLDHRAVADDHAPRVDAEVSGEVDQLGGQVPYQRREVVPPGERLAPVDRLRPGVHLLDGVAERLAHVAESRARPVGDHVGHLGGVQPAVALVDVLDDLFTPARLDVDVDVRWAVAGRGEEALEQQPEGDGVDVGDAEGVADGGGGRRPPALAEDVVAPAEGHDVPDGEEVAGEPERADDGELAVELRPGPRHPFGLPWPVAVGGAPADQLDQPGLLGVAGRHREVGEPWVPPGAGRTCTWRPSRRPAPPPRATGRIAGRCSASPRRQAVADGGSHPSRSARVRRARTAARAVARGKRAGVA